MRPLNGILALALLMALGVPGKANAMLPPHYYDQARRDAPNAVMIEVERVETLGPLSCAVHGRVLRMERGRLYRRNDAVRIEMPCIGHEPANPPAGGAIYQDTAQLRASRYGRAYLNDQGELMLSQYQIMDRANAPPPG